MGGGLESRCVGRVYGADGAVHKNKNYLVASSSHFTSFHEEGARSNNPQCMRMLVKIIVYIRSVHDSWIVESILLDFVSTFFAVVVTKFNLILFRALF